ncbi:MAG: hypothetical protein IPK18_10910 [Sphingobacteriales bacterium]|nr:MAG: hypothetical protein IPK18_10910 [Sphingobacteriales bacterium]
MKKVSIYFVVVTLVLLFTTQCKKDDTTTVSGIPEQVKNEIPDSLIQVLKDLGMPIYEGNNPPIVNGIYIISPYTLKNTNIPNDNPIGTDFLSGKIKFKNQNSTNRTIYYQQKYNYNNNYDISDNTLSYISGNNNYFTVFSITNITRTNTIGDTTDIQQFLFVYSGEKTTNNAAIKNIYNALLSTKVIKNTTNAF